MKLRNIREENNELLRRISDIHNKKNKVEEYIKLKDKLTINLDDKVESLLSSEEKFGMIEEILELNTKVDEFLKKINDDVIINKNLFKKLNFLEIKKSDNITLPANLISDSDSAEVRFASYMDKTNFKRDLNESGKKIIDPIGFFTEEMEKLEDIHLNLVRIENKSNELINLIDGAFEIGHFIGNLKDEIIELKNDIYSVYYKQAQRLELLIKRLNDIKENKLAIEIALEKYNEVKSDFESVKNSVKSLVRQEYRRYRRGKNFSHNNIRDIGMTLGLGLPRSHYTSGRSGGSGWSGSSSSFGGFSGGGSTGSSSGGGSW